MERTITTTWEIRTYDVWGNADDGYEVNDSFSAGTIELDIPITTHNAGTPHQFDSAEPTDEQIREALDIKPNIGLDIDGDDLTIYVNRESDGYPIGELFCTSHRSLSPIVPHASRRSA